jgi:hypothetical protein
MNFIKKFFILSFFIPYSAYAACLGSSPNLTAESANYADVKACIDVATYGDTINIPPCAAGACVWTTGIEFTKDIKIVGAGKESTILTVGFANDSKDAAFFKFTPDSTARSNLDSLDDTHTFIVSDIGFYYSGARLAYKYGVWINNFNTPVIKRIRVHDCSFTRLHRAIQPTGYVHGVFDSNTLTDTNAFYSGSVGLHAWENDVRKIGNGDAWFVEDNTFSWITAYGTISGAANDGGSHVVRYNTSTGNQGNGIYVETHSVAAGSRKGSQFTEIYGNLFASTASSGIDMRGGKVMVYFNKVNDDTIRVRQEYRDDYAGTLPANWTLMTQNPSCTGLGTPYECCTGIGTGTCKAQSCPADRSTNCYKINNSYLFNNRNYTNNTLREPFKGHDSWNVDLAIDSDPPELLENREYWMQRTTGTFNGSGDADKGGGVGCGTLSARPITCTIGVGYWATNQSCSDLNGMIGANPVSLFRELYIDAQRQILGLLIIHPTNTLTPCGHRNF